mgnify:CR=1 FL=1
MTERSFRGGRCRAKIRDMTTSSPFVGPLAAVLDQVESAVLDAAGYLVSALESGEQIDVTLKADHTQVLNLDLESQRRILSKLSGSFPILAEEDEGSHSLIDAGGSYFLVDPLDGTTSCKR